MKTAQAHDGMNGPVGQRIGVFGGAFDPPHNAHIALARAAIEQFALGALHIVPTGQAWHKARALSASSHRLAMARLAFEDIPRIVVDERELQRTGFPWRLPGGGALPQHFDDLIGYLLPEIALG